MQLVVLGRSGRYPEKNGATSGYLIKTNEVTLLLDMGSGVISRFQNFIGVEDIDAILFSHLHGDHMADFLPFNYMVAYLHDKIKKPIEIYRPATPKPVVELMGVDRQEMIFHDIVDKMTATIGDVEVTFMKVNHPVECYALRVHEKGGKTLLYTGDTTLFDGIESIFEGADVVLGDACVLEKDWTEKSPHIGVRSLAKMVDRVGAHFILTHLPDNEKEIEELLAEAKEVNEDSEIAKVMSVYNI